MARHLLDDTDVFPVHEKDLDLTIEPDPHAVYHVRTITTEKGREILKRHTRQVPNRQTHRKDDVTDNAAATNEMLDYAIAKWEHVQNGSDPAPCDLAHKLRLPPEVQAGILQMAQVGRSEDDRRASFRQPPPVV